MPKKKSKTKRKERKPSFHEQEMLPINKEEKKEIKKEELIPPNNNSEIIAKIIIEKILLNVIYEVKTKNFYLKMGLYCSNYLIKEINYLLSLTHLCYEKENSNTIFNDNYIRTQSSQDEQEEFIVQQPLPGELDRWKIYQLKLIKYKKKPLIKGKQIITKPKSIIINKFTRTKIKKENSIINKISKSQRNELKYLLNKEKKKKNGLKLTRKTNRIFQGRYFI